MSAPRPLYSDSAWFVPRKESTWHALRKPDVTATAAAALFGVSPYMTPFDLFHRLAGTVEVVFEENDRMKWGKRLEGAIAAGICEDHGWEIVDARPFLYVRHPTVAGMGASPDRIIRDKNNPDRGFGLLEIKNVDGFIAKDDWTEDEAPVHIEFQVQHQLEAAGLSWGVIGGLAGGNRIMVHERERDADVGGEIASRIAEMHDRVRRNDPPSPDYLADYETIRTLYRHAEIGKVLDLESPEVEADNRARILDLVIAERKAAAEKKNAEEDHKRIRAELLIAIGDHERVVGPDGWKIAATTTHRAESTVTYPASSYRNLRVSQTKPKEKK